MSASTNAAAVAAPQDDPEIKARYEVHKALRAKRGKPPFSFPDWLDCYLSGKNGGLKSDNDKSLAAKNMHAKRKGAAASTATSTPTTKPSTK